MTQTERLTAWYNGEIEYDELTAADIRELERRVFAAITRKVTAREGVHTFPEHQTVQ